MTLDFRFFLESIAFGIGLAMDAFSVSLANGLNEPNMKPGKSIGIAGVFAGFQIAMPLIGWLCVHTILTVFSTFRYFIPFIALALLGFIGGKMLYEGIKNKNDEDKKVPVGFWALIVQGVATSIDALSVGFDIASYDFTKALIESLIIGVVTFGICMAGLFIGRKVGTKLANKASILGGAILIAIGIEIFITGMIELFAA